MYLQTTTSLIGSIARILACLIVVPDVHSHLSLIYIKQEAFDGFILSRDSGCGTTTCLL